MNRFCCWIVGIALLAGLCGCYQMESQDDLRTVPVTNNPRLVPSQPGLMPSAPI